MHRLIVCEEGHPISFVDFIILVHKSRAYMNHYNIFYGQPEAESEKQYVLNRPRSPPIDPKGVAWKDIHGFYFTTEEFS